jgi:predicted O-methyltransferase YrrM
MTTFPQAYTAILEATKASDFNMASDPMTGSLLKTLAASKPAGKFLELGTGTGLSTSWILEGMDKNSHLTSIDNSADYLNIARGFLENDTRVELVLADADEWILANKGQSFDFVFADTWAGKYHLLDEVIAMLKPGGIYIVDDMLPQPNWPDGHEAKASGLSVHLLSRRDINSTRLDWATGIIVGVKK